MKKLRKYVGPILSFLLILLFLFLSAFYPRGREEAKADRVVRVWNVDTFEGGKGSRTSYLKSAAKRVQKERAGVYYLVSSYTAEGARAAFSEGNYPDALSFGVGLSEFAEKSLPLPERFSGGELGGECLAYPWCRGGYALFSLSDSFEEEGPCAISCGGENLPGVAARLSGVSGEELPSLFAYTNFLSGEYRYLLGTQRDRCRFEARGAAVYEKPLPEYCDLYQYFSILSPTLYEDCLALLKELLSSKERLAEIGMYPVGGDSGFAPEARRTVGIFTSREALQELRETASTGEEKNLVKFLKTV